MTSAGARRRDTPIGRKSPYPREEKVTTLKYKHSENCGVAARFHTSAPIPDRKSLPTNKRTQTQPKQMRQQHQAKQNGPGPERSGSSSFGIYLRCESANDRTAGLNTDSADSWRDVHTSIHTGAIRGHYYNLFRSFLFSTIEGQGAPQNCFVSIQRADSNPTPS